MGMTVEVLEIDSSLLDQLACLDWISMDEMSQDDFDAQAVLLFIQEMLDKPVVATYIGPDPSPQEFTGVLTNVCMADPDNGKEGLIYTLSNPDHQFNIRVTSLHYDIRPV